jgi:hypothetical protein
VAAAAGAGVVATLVVAIVIVTRRRRQPVGASLRLIGHRAVPPRPAGQAVQVRVSGTRRPSPSRPEPASQPERPGGRTWTVAAITDGGVPITGTGSSRGLSPSRRTPARGRQGRGASGHLDPASGSCASVVTVVTRSSGRRKAHRKHGAQKSLKRAAGTGTGD